MPPTISSSNSLSASDYGLQQLSLQQAKRNAERAEVAAEKLAAQAAVAKREAAQAQENARSLEIRSGIAHQDAGRARQGLAAIKTAASMQDQLYTALARLPLEPVGSVDEEAGANQPTISDQGTPAGLLIDTTA